MKRVIVAIALLGLTGCGFDWFPAPTGGAFTNSSTAFSNSSSAKGNALRPAAFTFLTKTVTTNEVISNPISDSDPVTLQGTAPDGWTLTATDKPVTVDSLIMVNDRPYARAGGVLGTITVYPGDKVVISQSNVSQLSGEEVTTTIKIGTYETKFVTKTQ